MKKKDHNHVIEQVPPNYYQKGVKNNVLQKAWHFKKLNAVLSGIDINPSKILDVGCASGWFLTQVSKSYPKAKCHGIDIYDKAIKFGEKKYPKIKFSVADADKIPYKANTFDLVICTEVLEHVDEPKKTLLEMKRVLKKNGRAVIELDSGSLLFTVVWYLWGLSKGKVWSHSHLHSFNVKTLERLLKSVGFVIISKKRFNIGMAMVFVVKKP